MSDDKAIQAEMHRAEIDLEDKIAQLKDVVKEKLETPKHVIETVEKPISWIAANRYLVAGMILGAGVVVETLLHWRRVRREARNRHLFVIG